MLEKTAKSNSVLNSVIFFFNRIHDSGLLRTIILSLIHIAQGSTIISSFFNKVPASVQSFLSWTTYLTKTFSSGIGSDIMENQILNIDAICMTMYFIFMVAAQLFERSPFIYTIIISVFLVPIGIGLSFIQTTGGIVVFILFLVILVILVVLDTIYFKKLFVPFIETFKDIYSDTSRLIQEKYFDFLSGLPIFMMAISGSCNKSTGLFFLYLFLVVALTAVQFVAYKFGGAVPQRMTQKLFILYLHYTFIPIIKKLVDATKVEGSVFWSVALFVVIFRMLLPIALQASSVWQLYKTACFLNDGEYRDYIMKSNRLHAYVSKGVKRSAYWWPFVEIVVKIFYAIFAACDQPIVACILMVLYAVAIIVIRPYDSWAFFTIAIGEALNLIIVDIAAAASPNGSTFSSYLVAFIIFLFFVPSFVALFLFIYFEKIPAFTRTYNIFEGAETDQFCGNLVFPGWILQKEETEKNEFALPLDYRIKKTNEIVDEAQRKTTYLLYYALIPFGMFVFSLSSASIFQISGANILNWRSLL